jgi:hypothetical protein
MKLSNLRKIYQLNYNKMILDLFKKEPTQEQIKLNSANNKLEAISNLVCRFEELHSKQKTIPTKTTRRFVKNIEHLIN